MAGLSIQITSEFSSNHSPTALIRFSASALVCCIEHLQVQVTLEERLRKREPPNRRKKERFFEKHACRMLLAQTLLIGEPTEG